MAAFARSSLTIPGIKTDHLECFRYDTQSEEILKRLQARPDLCDVVLIVGDSSKRISAHRLILIASSDYFSTLLSEPMGEFQQREITLNEVDVDALEKLVNFCYTGSLELRGDTINALLATANHVQLEKVVERCCEFLLRHLQPSNCLAVLFFAEQLNLEALLHNAKKFICENFEEVSNHPDFFLLTAKQLNEFIANDDLNVSSEEFVFQVLMKWIEYDPETRRKHFTELLALLRLPRLPPTFLVEKVEPLCNTIESQKLVLNAFKSHLMVTSNSVQPKQSKSVANQLLVISSRIDCFQRIRDQLEIASYNLRTNEWTIWNTPISFRLGFAVALMDDNLIVVGGSLGGSTLNTVTSFNLRTMASSEMAPLATSRSSHCVANLNGSIYTIGGLDNKWEAINSVERLDPRSGTWYFVAPMKTARFNSSVAVINGRLYICGGDISSTGYVASVECYDPLENIWRSTAPMKMPRYSHRLVAHNGYLFAIGGRSNPALNIDIPRERYDPRADTWTSISCSTKIYGATRCASVGGDLFIYNNSNFYVLSSDSNCDNMKLHTLPKPYPNPNPSQIMSFNCSDLVAIPYEFSSPESWFKNEELNQY